MKTKPLVIALFSLFLMGCSSSPKYLDKPKDTDLSFWITEKVDNSSFRDCTFIPGGFGVNVYLDSRYKSIPVNGQASLPSIYVTYHVTKYPDYSDKDSCVTRIEIKDPVIDVYGLTRKSNLDDVSVKRKSLGFEEKDNSFRKNNCSFVFSSDGILINAYVSNRNHISF